MTRRRIEGRTSAELRAGYVAERFVPTAAAVLAGSPEVLSVIDAVGQFWNDEANDAVQEAVVATLDLHPRWPDRFSPVIFDDEGFLQPICDERWRAAGTDVGKWGRR